RSPGGVSTVISSSRATLASAGTSPTNTPRPPADAALIALIRIRIGLSPFQTRGSSGLCLLLPGPLRSPRSFQARGQSLPRLDRRPLDELVRQPRDQHARETSQ